MKISVVIPNYNGRALLRQNLPKVLEAVGDAEVVIVDDASTDGSVKEIQNRPKGTRLKIKNDKAKIKIFENKKNTGFASTVNRGVNEATAELVVLLNTDVIPEEDFLESSLKHFADPQVFAVGLLQKCQENGKMIERGRGVGSFKNGFLTHAKGQTDKNNTLWVSGGAGVFRKSIWSKLEGLQELYSPFYWEDIDLSYRALKAGYKLIFEPKSVVAHMQGKTIGRSFNQNKIKTIAYRNQILFVWLNITDLKMIIQHLLYLPYHLIKSLFTFDFPFIQALFYAFMLLPGVLIKRQKNKKSFKLSDFEILKDFYT